MKAILMSIQSKWLCEILNGRRTVKLRKRFPKDYRGWLYLYCTKAKPYLSRYIGTKIFELYDKDYIDDEEHGRDYLIYDNGKVVARVWVDNVEQIIYFNPIFAIYFSKLEIFDKPKELGEFSVERYAEMPNGVFPCYEPIIKAPQSWQYVEVEE